MHANGLRLVRSADTFFNYQIEKPYPCETERLNM